MGRRKQGIPELIAPAGDMDRLRAALHFGADAIYLSGKSFSLRNFSKNFTLEEMSEAVRFTHEQGRRAYLAANIFLRNRDLEPFRGFCSSVSGLGFDAVIVSDPAAIRICRDILPDTPLHLSTQVNTLNRVSAASWFEQGIQRIVLARELSLEEIREIKSGTGGEIEIFVHGAMCMSYSGRCLLSLYLADREANQGTCTQSCRWKYAIVEEKRPGTYLPVEEDSRGTYILNSKDLCLLGCLPELIRIGVDAFKIEGRQKGIHYLATVVRAYRFAMDCYRENPQGYRLPDVCREELSKLNSREFTTGFIMEENEDSISLESNTPVSPFLMAGLIESGGTDGWWQVDVRGFVRKGDRLEHLGKDLPNPVFTVSSMRTLEGGPCEEAHSGTRVWIHIPVPAEPGDLLRRCEAVQANAEEGPGSSVTA